MNGWVRLAASVGVLSFAGGMARLTFSYTPGMGVMGSARIVTNSVYMGCVVGLLIWEPLNPHPTYLLGIIGSFSWLGIDIAKAVYTMVVNRVLGGGKVDVA